MHRPAKCGRVLKKLNFRVPYLKKKVRPIALASYGDLSYIYYVRPDLKHPPGSFWAHIVRPGTWPKIACLLGLSYIHV